MSNTRMSKYPTVRMFKYPTFRMSKYPTFRMFKYPTVRMAKAVSHAATVLLPQSLGFPATALLLITPAWPHSSFLIPNS